MMQTERMINSVKNLINLYTVVIGVALSLAIAGLIDPKKGLESVTLSATLLFASFVATLLPFYHGALRHLDDTYIENENPHIKNGAFIIDFLLLFLHGIAFVVLSLLVSNPSHFIWILVGLLSIDVLWGVFTHFGSSSYGPYIAEWKWALINFVFIILSVGYLIMNDIYLSNISNPKKLSLLIFIVCLLRTIIDYVWCRTFYFPKDE